MKKYVLISGFNTHDFNRGTAALSYGAINFCIENGYLKEGQEIVDFRYVKKIWKSKYRDYTEFYTINGKIWKRTVFHIFEYEKLLYDKFQVKFPYSKFKHVVDNLSLVACINGGDGFSDIYSTKTFYFRLIEANIAFNEKIPVIQLPQTIGPFENDDNYRLAIEVLKNSQKVYIRDEKYIDELIKNGIEYTLSKDLSYYMLPEKWDIDIDKNCIGLNISGLCYSNQFRGLAGQFNNYPMLINRIIEHFQTKNKTIYLIPHSYNYINPEPDNDDMVACRTTFSSLANKKNVILIDSDLSSPQVKYIISKMTFFIGTRMHANFAAIYTKVPVYGLAYSYKFEGAFTANGLNGEEQTSFINNIKEEDIESIISKIDSFYQKTRIK